MVISLSSTSRPCVLCSFVIKPHRFVSQDSVLRVQIKSSPIPLSFRTFFIGKVWRQGTQVGYGSYFLCRLDLIWPHSYGNFHGICHYCIDSSLSLQLEQTSFRGVQVTLKKYHSMRINSLVFLITNNNTGQNIPVHLSNVCSFNDKG